MQSDTDNWIIKRFFSADCYVNSSYAKTFVFSSSEERHPEQTKNHLVFETSANVILFIFCNFSEKKTAPQVPVRALVCKTIFS